MLGILASASKDCDVLKTDFGSQPTQTSHNKSRICSRDMGPGSRSCVAAAMVLARRREKVGQVHIDRILFVRLELCTEV